MTAVDNAAVDGIVDHANVVRKIVDAAPPLTAEQRTRLAVLLRPCEDMREAA